ncbi:hypothetical protein QTP70_013626 [Hemibagrus guttatus]|uniref:Tf2-1-like SH3-like domain-containing protein n=1 Tax=Hemibagrus guttatus TaxID=175788 RepID=A0AAE0PTY7_9TELE|nr:hypothetical protein QTP70_013626 [Hemibagrus guttatus]
MDRQRDLTRRSADSLGHTVAGSSTGGVTSCPGRSTPIHSSTGLTPFQCMLGYQPPLFPWSGELSDVPAVEEWYRRSQEVWERAHVRLQRAVCRQRIQTNRRRCPHPSYQVGQMVWLSTRNLRLKLPCLKLSPKFIGPFEIVRQVNPVAYRLRLPATYRICPTFHVSLLKPAHPSAGEVPDGGSHHRLWMLRGLQHTVCMPSLIPGGFVRGFSTSWIGRATVSRNALGWRPPTFWIRPSWRTSTATTRTGLLRVRGVARGVEPQEVSLEGGGSVTTRARGQHSIMAKL